MMPHGWCGMSPRTGTQVAGLYMIMVCILYIVFETGHLKRARVFINGTEEGEIRDQVLIILLYYYIALISASVTLLVCIMLLISCMKNHYKGVLAYIIWQILYDILNSVLLGLTESTLKKVDYYVSTIEWIGLGFRIAMDCFWLPYAIVFCMELYELDTKG
uniref:Uncharacterized protein n=1 Tax=Latimeria chalumnae TaxID=7897 RepID=H3BBA3_LATCH